MINEQRLQNLGLFLIVIAAIFSTGFHHPDEYMQIVEFANVKLGGMNPQLLPWEWHERMRPFFMPGLLYAFDRIFRPLLQNPFWIMIVFRLFHGLLAFWGLRRMVLQRAFFLSEKQTHSAFPYLVYLLWFIPWFAVRPSSEGLSASLFLLSLTQLFGDQKSPREQGLRNIFISGLFAGFSFLARYQMGFMIAGFFGWLCFVEKISLRKLWLFIAAIVACAGLGIAIDTWGYSEFVLTTWNYLYQNVVLNKSANWGTDPFYGYLYLMQQHGMPLHSILILGAMFLTWYRYPRHFLTWCSVPFFIVHSLIAHKEMRFLFPLALFAPAFLLLGYGPGIRWISFSKWIWNFRKTGWIKFFAVTNILALLFLMLAPTRTEISLQKEIYTLSDGKAFGGFLMGRDPYIVGDYPMHYYQPKRFYLQTLQSIDELKLQINQNPLTLITSEFDFYGMNPTLQSACREVYRGMPVWFKYFDFNHWLSRSQSWSIYQCDRTSLF